MRSKATPFLKQLRHGELPAETQPLSLKPGRQSPYVALCSEALHCDAHVKQALPLQLLMLLPSRGFACVFLVTFGDDRQISNWIKSELSWALELGLLRLASGGAVGLDEQRDRNCAGCLCLSPLQIGHASQGKNTSHMFAIQSHKLCGQIGDLILVSLDADNVLEPDYVLEVAKAMGENKELAMKHSLHPSVEGGGDRSQVLGLPSRSTHGGGAPHTGRVALWATDYVIMGGRDQELGTVPSGLEDVDLLTRACKAFAQQSAGSDVKPLSVMGGGCEFRNLDMGSQGTIGVKDPEVTPEPGSAKVEHCEPRFKTLSLNKAAMNQKTLAGDLVRNISEQEVVGVNNLAAPYRPRLELCLMTLGAFFCWWPREPFSGSFIRTSACSSDQVHKEAGAPEPPEGRQPPPQKKHIPHSVGVPLEPHNVEIFIMTAGQPGNVVQSVLAQ
jgi:hypothetical protein